jgi:DNA (cytosine-5)-methyltransferase 1
MKLLDLFCGAGGAGMGYHRAGFEVVGVDNKPQKHYPFEFHQADALEYLAEHGAEFDVIHASPPCQRYTIAQRGAKNADAHPDSLPLVRERLQEIGKPWIIENVPGAPMDDYLMLCGSMFEGLEVRRHRWFQSNMSLPLIGPTFCNHNKKIISVFGHGSGSNKRSDWGTVADWKRAMGIDWMTRDELSQAIPPAYTEWIGRRIMDIIQPPPPASSE